MQVSLAAEDRLQIAVAAMLACLLPNLELQVGARRGLP